MEKWAKIGRLQVSQKILKEGHPARYDGQPIKELALLTMSIEAPDPQDGIIKKFGDCEPEWAAMRQIIEAGGGD